MTSVTEAPSALAFWGAGAAILVLVLLAALLAAAEPTPPSGRGHRAGDREAARAFERERSALVLGAILAAVAAACLGAWIMDALIGPRGLAVVILLVPALIVTLAEVERIRTAPRTGAHPEPGAGFSDAVVTGSVAVLAPIASWLRALARPVKPRRAAKAEPHAPQESPTMPATDSPAPDEERERLLGALDLGERRVEEIMMPRRDIEMIDADADPASIFAQAINSTHTRLPVYRGEPENIVGVVHAKDLSRAVHRFVQTQRGGGALDGFDIMDAVMKPYFVPETTPLDEQMREFLRRRSHFALVVDEYGALQGLVTLEDILEQIVGDIADEHDLYETTGIVRLADGLVEVEGGVSIRDLNRACDWTLPDEEANTIAGLVIHEAQAIPNAGQSFSFHGFRFEVLAREGNRLTQLRVSPLDA